VWVGLDVSREMCESGVIRVGDIKTIESTAGTARHVSGGEDAEQCGAGVVVLVEKCDWG